MNINSRWLSRTEIAACSLVVLWLQVVGCVTTQVLHHVIHAAPVFVLLIIPRNRWTRLLGTLTGFLWVFMLSVITPMVHHGILEGGLWHDGGLFVWLAPILAVLCAFWMSLNLTILAEDARGLPSMVIGSMLLVPMLALLYPVAGIVFETPVERVVEGRLAWATMLATELALLLVVPWCIIAKLAHRADLRPRGRMWIWLGLYWAFFLVCMIAGLLPAVNP